MNNQQMLLCQGLLMGIKNGTMQQPKVISLHVTDKYDTNLKFEIEVYPNATQSAGLPYRVITSAGEGLWNTWESISHIEKSFKEMSLI